MKILYSPQLSNKKITYSFNSEVVTVDIDGVVEEFDFSTMPNGRAEKITPEVLSINPIVEAERMDGVLNLVLINFITEDASQEELFPEWQEVLDENTMEE